MRRIVKIRDYLLTAALKIHLLIDADDIVSYIIDSIAAFCILFRLLTAGCRYAYTDDKYSEKRDIFSVFHDTGPPLSEENLLPVLLII